MWLPCEAPFVRNHARRAPQASAASTSDLASGVGLAGSIMRQVSWSMPLNSMGLSMRSASAPTIELISGAFVS